MSQPIQIDSPLAFSDSSTSKNRFFKSAMSEQLGDAAHNPSAKLIRLYQTWAQGGTGILVTGNVMIDRSALGEPKNVVLDEASDLSRFRDWAQAGTQAETQLWMQLNHPGKQIPNMLSKEPVAPSAIPLGKGLEKAFNCPRALEEAEIEAIIERFATAARLAKESGFSGVQIHGAHGYLVSQFLSPHHNRREDRWGGSLENRMRFVLEAYRAIRKAVGESFPVGIKLNSADFQRGGFAEDDSLQVMQALQKEGINLIEVSGGNYENPNMMGAGVKDSTKKREAYFLDFAEKAKAQLSVPLVVTGGFRSVDTMNEALGSGACDMIGLGRPLAIDPAYPNKLLSQSQDSISWKEPSTGVKQVDFMAMISITWYEHQLARIGEGKRPDPKLNAWVSVAKTFWGMGKHGFQQRRA